MKTPWEEKREEAFCRMIGEFVEREGRQPDATDTSSILKKAGEEASRYAAETRSCVIASRTVTN
jgi:hypothetical protein